MSTYHKRSRIEQFFSTLNLFFILLITFSILLPFIHVYALAFNDGRDAAQGGVYFFPRVFSLENFSEIFSNSQILKSYFITISRTFLGTVTSLFFTAMAAFVLKNNKLPGSKLFTIMIMFTMLFSGGLIPYYMVLKNLKLINTFGMYIIPSLFGAWNILILRTFFKTIPVSLEESAKLDGCNDFTIFIRFFVPLSKASLSVIGLFNAVGHWNDWFTGAFFIRSRALKPVQTILQEMLTKQLKLQQLSEVSYSAMQNVEKGLTGESLKMAMVVVVSLPIICVYPFIQKYFVQGMMIGSIKE